MFENDLEVLVWAGALHGGFLILLILCLLLHCCSWWPRNHHKRVQLAVAIKSRIRAVVDSRIEGLRAAVKKVIVARIDDGLLAFSDETQGAESDLFLLVRGLLDEFREGLPQDQLTFLHRCVKMELQASPYELRGSRRAAVLSDFIQKALKKSSIYSPGCMSKIKRSCCFPKGLGLWYGAKVFAAVIVPVLLVAVDLSSDGGMVYSMADYGISTLSAGTRTRLTTLLADTRALDNSTGTTTAWDTSTATTTTAWDNSTATTTTAWDNSTATTTTAWDNTTTMANYRTVTEPTNTAIQDNTTNKPTAGDRDAGAWQVMYLMLTSGIILCLATGNLLWSNPLPCLLRLAHTAVAMGSRKAEEKDVPLPLDTVTRFDMAMSEATGEAAWQFVLQWLFYFSSVAAVVRYEDDMYKKLELTLSFSLVFSTVMSLNSLTMAQYKAQMLTRQFSSSFPQKVVCFLSSLCSTASSQVLITQSLYAISETSGVLGLGLALFSPVFIIVIYRQCCSSARAVRGSPLIQFAVSMDLGYSTVMEFFQLQSSRATMTPGIRLIVTRRIFLQPQHRGMLFRQNLVAHIVLEIVSLTCLGLSLGLSDHFPGGLFIILLPPVYTTCPALRNFFLTAAILGPAGWILAQGLDWINNCLDSGSQTCGLDFIYEEEEEDGNAENKNKEEDNSVEDINRTMREDILSALFRKEVSFLSETGRWSHPEEQEEHQEQEEQEEHNIGVAQELEEMV